MRAAPMAIIKSMIVDVLRDQYIVYLYHDSHVPPKVPVIEVSKKVYDELRKSPHIFNHNGNAYYLEYVLYSQSINGCVRDFNLIKVHRYQEPELIEEETLSKLNPDKKIQLYNYTDDKGDLDKRLAKELKGRLILVKSVTGDYHLCRTEYNFYDFDMIVMGIHELVMLPYVEPKII